MYNEILSIDWEIKNSARTKKKGKKEKEIINFTTGIPRYKLQQLINNYNLWQKKEILRFRCKVV